MPVNKDYTIHIKKQQKKTLTYTIELRDSVTMSKELDEWIHLFKLWHYSTFMLCGGL